MKGLIHIYCGDGKGKTTAAIGLAIRAAGAGKHVVFAQFLKDGTSSEIEVLRSIPCVRVMHADTVRGWFRQMTAAQQAKAGSDYEALMERALAAALDSDMLILDEAAAACELGVIDKARLLAFLQQKPENLEVVLTGQKPSDDLRALADYVTEMKKIKHPYDGGVTARRGIEF